MSVVRGSQAIPACRDTTARPSSAAAPPAPLHPSRAPAQRPRPVQHAQQRLRCKARPWSGAEADVEPSSGLKGAAVCLVGALAACCTAAAAPGPALAFQRTAAAPFLSSEEVRKILLQDNAAILSKLREGEDTVAKDIQIVDREARVLVRQQEAELVRLRDAKEAEVVAELNRARSELETEGRLTQLGKLCATPFGIDVVGITEFVALIGALVGGVTSRQRKDEVERLNEQLRKINMSLRQQARAGTIYAPGLTYIPPSLNGGSSAYSVGTMPVATPESVADYSDGSDTDSREWESKSLGEEVDEEAPLPVASYSAVKDGAAEAVKAAGQPGQLSIMSMDEESESAEARQCLQALKEGKRLLKDKMGAPAMVRFEKGVMMAKFVGNKVQERRAVRGLAAAARLQGQHQTAISHLKRVLEISNEMGDHVGDADAFGTIADIYTDMGDFDKAAEFYDKYISRMNSDGPV